MQSFGHKMLIFYSFIGNSNQRTFLTKVVNEYALMMEIPCRPLNMESVCAKNVYSVTPFTGTGVMYLRLRDFLL